MIKRKQTTVTKYRKVNLVRINVTTVEVQDIVDTNVIAYQSTNLNKTIKTNIVIPDEDVQVEQEEDIYFVRMYESKIVVKEIKQEDVEAEVT